MDKLKIKSLNLLKLPLKGESLIEASAGTGKTFAIVLLYLRLLLGLGENGNSHRPLKVTEILVVTFTDNATSELRYRIRKNIHALRMTCLNYETNSQFNDLVKQIINIEEANKLLFVAEQQIDEAAIFTIHSFCQRMLNLNAFESCVLFERKFMENDFFLLQQATADFWRKHCYYLKPDIASIILKEWNGPDALLNKILPYLHLRNKIPDLKIKDNEINDIQLHHICTINYIKIIKNQWIANYKEIENILFNVKIDKRSYNSRYLPLWINKITKWAKTETINYLYPKELKYFSQELITKKINKGSILSHSLFISIEKFIKKDLSIRDIFIKKALTYINKTLYKEKLLRSVISFDDLLILLDEALHKQHGEILADNIRKKYPIALIDEFQDTDQLQYRIFKKIYFNQKNYGLILIGDPKQAIYSFRGANVFTYIIARNELNLCYTLDTNWRSSSAMVSSVNQLFSRIEYPFLFSVIPFRPVLSAEDNKHLRFEINNELQPAIKYWLQPVKKTNVTDYQLYMAHQCAVNISQLLEGAKNGKVFIGHANNLRMLKASDITVLVRNHSEADIIINELNAINIPSAYLSNRNSVYNTHTARELLLLLQGILFLEQENIFRTALATSLLGFDSTVLDITNKNSQNWNSLIEKFLLWRDIWYKNGIFTMLRNIIKEQKLAETLLASTNGNRYLINFMHLSELLQIASVNLDCPIKILSFLENQIQHPNEQDINQQIRLESDHNLIQIITIHKSKGLQYPLVWLPFAANFNKDLSLNSNFIDDFSDQSINQKTLSLRDKELLSENLRLLYVALTRSIYHCSVGIAPLNHTRRNKNDNTDFHQTAIGFLLQYGKTADDVQLKNYLYEMMANNKYIKVIDYPVLDKTICQNKTSADIPQLNFRNFTRDLTRVNYINSYSSLHQNNNDITETISNFEITNYQIKDFYISDNLTPHNFPKGSKAGTFLHNLLNSLEFNLFPEQSWLEKRLQESGYSDKWISVLESWIFNILNVSLGVDDIQLSKLESKNKLIEMEFYIPIKNQIRASSLNKLIQHYDPISRYAPSLNFKQIKGMLKGFIDLVFSWKGKYYIVDYKSNCLGDSEYNYTMETINQSMIDHRYDLQYQIYCLALHRYLKQRLRYYKYEYHFGGVFYLFLRGMVATIPKSGIFTTVPSYDFITSLDSLFLENKSIHE